MPNDGKWTQGRLNSFISSALRSARWPPKYNAKKTAFLGKLVNANTGRMCSHYQCASCKGTFPSSEVEVNHKVPVVDPKKGFESWDKYIERLFCDSDNLEVLCKTCHKRITAEQRKERKNASE